MVKSLKTFMAFLEGDEPPMTACGGNLIGGEISRNEQCPHEADLRRLRLRTWGKSFLCPGPSGPAYTENMPMGIFSGRFGPPKNGFPPENSFWFIQITLFLRFFFLFFRFFPGGGQHRHRGPFHPPVRDFLRPDAQAVAFHHGVGAVLGNGHHAAEYQSA